MSYLDENGLARYDGLIKQWVTFKSGTVDGVDPLLNWQKTSTAASVTFYPLPAAPIDPVVTFAFTETDPAEGDKSPTNPSTITGVSSITVTRCETEGVDSTDYTVNLGSTYYGGSVDLSAGTMTVTYRMFEILPSVYFTTGGVNEMATGIWQKQVLNLNDTQNLCNTFGYNPSAGFNGSSYFCNTHTWDNTGKTVSYHFSRLGFYLSTTAESQAECETKIYNMVSDLYSAGTPIICGYPLENPYTVSLTPTQIYSLSQPDPYTPCLNTVYSDQASVQVGYPKSPQATQTELTNAIISLGGEI